MIKKIKVFIDSNIPMYAAGNEHPNKTQSIEILGSISENKITGITSTEVMQEILYRYSSIGLLEKGLEVFDSFSQIVDDILPVNFDIINGARKMLGKDSFHRACWNTGTAVNALLRFYVKHLICGGSVDTVHGANVSAGFIFHANTRFCDNVWHSLIFSFPFYITLRISSAFEASAIAVSEVMVYSG